MIEALGMVCLFVAVISFFSIVAGLYKPVLVLWFLDRMNRLMVLKYYGIVGVIAGLLYLVLRMSFV